MSTAELLPKLPDLTVEQAEHWVAAALAEASALRQHDAQLAPEAGDAASLRTAEQLHEAWERWVEGAEAVCDRTRPLTAAGHHVDGADDLGHLVGRAKALLAVKPSEVASGRDEARRGQVVSMREMRDGLRDRLQRGGAAGV